MDSQLASSKVKDGRSKAADSRLDSHANSLINSHLESRFGEGPPKGPALAALSCVEKPSQVGDLSINREHHCAQRGARRIPLTPREYAILEHLICHAGKPVSRTALMREVWNLPFDPTTNIVDVYMKYLRDKIDRDDAVKLIRTVRGVGYLLSDD